MPKTVGFVYSDGSREKLPVTWSQVDVSQAGVVTVKGTANGRGRGSCRGSSNCERITNS